MRPQLDFKELVVNLVGLGHYDVAHLRALGLRSVIWAQSWDGKVRQ